MKVPYFRPGAGCVVYRKNNDVLLFKRTGEDVWQFQQGGMKAGEIPEETLWRELEEETALTKQDFIVSHSYPTWTIYEYPDDTLLPSSYLHCLGQTHRWWFLEIAPNIEIDLTRAIDKEFEEYKWLSFTNFMTLSTHSFKQPVYDELYEYFKEHISKN